MTQATANDWWRAARADLKGMEICYKKELYGLSAYHCQQALEKAVKAAVIYHNIPVDPKTLGHNILYKMFEKMISEIPIDKEHKEYNHKIVQLLKSVGQNVQFETDAVTVDNNTLTKDFFWGQSMGIEVANKDLEEFLEKIEKLTADATNKSSLPLLSFMSKWGQSIQSNNFEELIEYISNDPKLKFKISKPELRLWNWALCNILTILMIIPHEEYGRYPGTVNGKQREEWYRRNCINLAELESYVRRAIVMLCKNVLKRR